MNTPDDAPIGDRLRALVDDALRSTRADRLRPLRLLREVLGTANDLAGRPFRPLSESARRRERRAAAAAIAPSAPREPAPVMLYFDGQDHRTLGRVEELLRSRAIPYKLLDVADDEATRAWAIAQARADPERAFPLVFVAGEPIGGLHELTQADVNGALRRRVFGA
jgi:hypothetical protein